MAPRALIVGIAGLRLSPDERDYLASADPWGVILFARNIADPDQLGVLTADIRSALGRADAPILVDQEGGRVQRLGPPHWPAYPSAGAIGRVYRRDPESGLEAARLAGRLIALDLADVGISVPCLPVADLRLEGAHAIIGERAYSHDPAVVAALARAASEGVFAGGCLPVVKHMPGHGRAACDSHLDLPRVEASLETLRAADFAPFRMLCDLPMAMTAHIVFTALDRDRPVTLSARIISELIRGEIGFDGLLMSDDLSMGALSGPVPERGAAAVAAGCDIALHCNGDAVEMAGLALSVARLSGRALSRAEAALAARCSPEPIDRAAARARLDALVASAAGAGA